MDFYFKEDKGKREERVGEGGKVRGKRGGGERREIYQF